jgi:hypothetical protein
MYATGVYLWLSKISFETHVFNFGYRSSGPLTGYLSEQVREDPWLFFIAKWSQSNKVSETLV